MTSIPSSHTAAYKSLPSIYYTYITKPKFKHSRYPSPFHCYLLHTGHACVDGYYWSKGEMASAVLSEGLALYNLLWKQYYEQN